MAVSDALWVGGGMLDVAEARINLGGLLWADDSAPTVVRTGVLYSGVDAILASTADTAPMSVRVRIFHFVGMKSQTEGPYLGSNYTVETAFPVAAPPALGSKRIDVVYVMQQDSAAGTSPDAVTAGKLGVLQGVAGSSPAKPTALPVGAVEVGTITYDCTSVVPTKTSDAQVTLATTCRWTTLKNQPLPVRSAAERDALTGNYTSRRVIRLDRGGLVQTFDGTKWRGQRKHADAKTVVLDSSGYATVTHGAGFTPSHVTVNVTSPISGSSSSGILMQNGTDTYGASTFRVRVLNALGAAVSGSCAITYECVEAQD